ncbi:MULTISPECIES: PsiF family protein [Achromobacter]|uniref:PsiF repeat family protein n=1 Tax=Alcaligenes xylosoxydans xylosoxydans TaxID=85698 RepID=A0A109XXE8_ALCXX|nr:MULTISPECIES: PsiF family protein [Achromobacter]AMG38393.1 PsiF repeat family protein [Achromobacter xylosoxidans]
MLSRTSQLASAIVLSACCFGAVYAQTPAATPAPAKTPAPAATPAAKTPTPQQQRMADCNKSAEGKKGDDRKTYMSACLKGEAPAPAKELTPQQQKMKDCNAKAGEQKLTGDKRKTFMSTCLKG